MIKIKTMKKTFVLILMVLMIFGIILVPVSASEDWSWWNDNAMYNLTTKTSTNVLNEMVCSDFWCWDHYMQEEVDYHYWLVYLGMYYPSGVATYYFAVNFFLKIGPTSNYLNSHLYSAKVSFQMPWDFWIDSYSPQSTTGSNSESLSFAASFSKAPSIGVSASQSYSYPNIDIHSYIFSTAGANSYWMLYYSGASDSDTNYIYFQPIIATHDYPYWINPLQLGISISLTANNIWLGLHLDKFNTISASYPCTFKLVKSC